MKIAVLILSLVLIQTAVSQVTRQACIDSGIAESSLPVTIPVENPDPAGPCADSNSCCTSQYIDNLRDNIKIEVFRDCVKDSLRIIIDIAEDFFNDFTDSFGDSARDSLFSSYSIRAGVGDDTAGVYIDNELTYSSQLLANLTFKIIRGDENDKVRFQKALREYACDYIASLVQKNSYLSSLRLSRLDGSCICELSIGDETVGSRVDTIIESTIDRFTSTIDNIARLRRAISAIKDASLQNLRMARDFNVSTICTRQFINAIACQHCRGDDTRTCPASCRVVSYLCLQPLRAAFTEPFGDFISFVRLALNSIIGDNLDSVGRFDLHDFQEIAGALNRQLNLIQTSVARALEASIASGDDVLSSDCFITRQRDIDDGTFICQDTSERDDSKPDCTREEGDKEIVDERPISGGGDGDSVGGQTSITDTSDEKDRRKDDDFDHTSRENDFVSFVKRLLAQFNEYGNFAKVFARINTCVCRAQNTGTSGDASGDSAGKDRLSTLFVAPSPTDCFKRYSDLSTDDSLETNPAYRSLTDVERTQVMAYGDVVSEGFTNLQQLVSDDPDTLATFEQLMGSTPSHAGRLLTSLLLVLSTALLTILFV